MSPHLIIILTLSSCALLIMLLFAIRKKSQKRAEAPLSMKTSEESLPDLSTLDFSHLENFSPKIKPLSVSLKEAQNEQAFSEIIELVSRYRFFQGKNFERFQEFAQQKNWQKIEQLITEKFQAQRKTNPQQMAQEITQKLLILQHS